MKALTQLQELILHNNALNGPIPDLSTLTQLRSLILFNNQLSGRFPDLSMHYQLQELYLSDNQLCGVIPLWLTTLPQFNNGSWLSNSHLTLNNNHFTLPIDPVLIKFLDDHYIAWKNQSLIETCEDSSIIISTDDVDDINNLVITGLNQCHASSTIDVMYINYGNVLSNIVIGEYGNIAGGKLDGIIDNYGIVSQVNILPGTLFKGGLMTGYIVNQGTIINVKFIGAELRGGIVGGTFVNRSRVGGVLRDVQLMGGTRIIGGIVAGFIKGDICDPARLENVTVRSGIILSGVTIGNNVTVQENVSFQ